MASKSTRPPEVPSPEALQGATPTTSHGQVDRSNHYPTPTLKPLPPASPPVGFRTQQPASGLTLTTELSHWLQRASLDELASVVREVEFSVAARYHAAGKYGDSAAAGFWRGMLLNTSALVKALEKQGELRRARRAPKEVPDDYAALPPFDSSDVGGAP